MSTNDQAQARAYPPPPADRHERMRAFLANRRLFPPDEWLRHVGRQIAVSWDGKAIIASDPTFEGLLQRLQACGIDPSEVFFEWISDEDSSEYGGAALEIVHEPIPESTAE